MSEELEPRDWIAVDLDGTLAHYESGDYARFGAEAIGPPVHLMLTRVKRWLDAGEDVRIFTARVPVDPSAAIVVKAAIRRWCEEHIGMALPITSQKDGRCKQIWDDRAVGVVRNTGLRSDGKDTDE